MFDNENLKEGVTLTVVRFDGAKGNNQLSIIPRFIGDKACAEGVQVIMPVITRRKEKLQKDLEMFESGQGVLLKVLWEKRQKKPNALEKLFGLKRFTKADSDELDSLIREQNLLQSAVQNPLFDFDLVAGEALLEEIKVQLKEKGFELKEDSRKSNGELAEQILHFA